MTARRFIHTLTACAAAAAMSVSMSMLAAPVLACESGACPAGTQVAQATQVTETKPLKLRTFMRKPVATSATRTVKKKNGEYAKSAVTKSAIKRDAKQQAVPKQPLTAPQPAPETISPAAAQAFASYELARVRVVTPEETAGASLLADTTPLPPDDGNAVSVDNVQIVSAEEINDIDRQADSASAVSLDALSRDLATSAEPQTDDSTWFQRMLMVLGGAFAAAAALAKTLLG